MSDKSAVAAPKTLAATLTKVPKPTIQRKCACGGTVGPSGMCAECEKKKKQETIQRKGAGAGGGIAAIPSSVGSVLGSTGRPLEPGVRSSMESRFGTSLGAVRIHTDSRAAESARALNAQAYTVGNNIVFDHGKYDPVSAGGSKLLAHELAHTIQQGGIQAKSYDGLSVSPSNSPLELEADRAADAVTSGYASPSLSKVNAPLVSRATPDPTNTAVPVDPVAPTNKPTVTSTSGPSPLSNVPTGADGVALAAAGVKSIQGSTAADWVFILDDFPLNQNKGEIAEKLYDQLAGSGQLRAVMNTSGKGGSTALKQGRDDSTYLRNAWIQKYSWASTSAVANWNGLGGKAPAGQPFKPVRDDGLTCHMDHIQELQVGGAGNPSNIQVLDPDPNIESGRDINAFLKQKAQEIMAALGPNNPPTLTLQFRSVQKIPPAPSMTLGSGKPSCIGIETALLTGKNPAAGAGPNPALATRVQYLLYSGVQSASAYLNKSNPVTDLTNTTVMENRGAMLLVPSLILKKYTKGAGGNDTIDAEIDPNKLGNRTSQSRIPITITTQPPFKLSAVPGSPAAAAPVTVTNPPAAGSPTGTPPVGTGTVTPGKAGEEATTAAETRTIKLNKAANPTLAFHYPYLSEGTLKLTPNEAGELTGTGTLKPSIPLLSGKILNLDLQPDKLSAVMKSDIIGSKILGIGTITDASLTADLLPNLGASGKLAIAFGSPTKPIATTSLTLSADTTNGFMAQGKLIANIPQVDQAEGDITYKNGNWFGSVTISSSQIKIPMVKSSTIVVSFSDKGVQVAGGVVMDVKGNPVELKASLVNGNWVFSGAATLTFSPLKPVRLSFVYSKEKLTAEGDTTFTFKGLEGKVHVKYDDGVVTGDGTLNMKRGKMSGTINAHYTKNGNITADGTISYQVSENLIATVGISVDEAQNVRLTGELTFPKPIQLFNKIGNSINLFSAKMDIPIAGISVGPVSIGLVFRIEGGLGFDYGVGPGQIRNLHLSAGFNPFDDDPKFDLKGGGQLYIPASAGVTGSVRGALAVSAGIASISGGITATARAGIEAALTADLEIQYKEGRFTLDSTVALIGKPVLDFGLEANVEAEVGVAGISYKYHKGYELASFKLPSSMEMGAKFPVHYASNEPFKFPSLSDIQVIKPDIDVKGMMDSMLTKVGAM